VSLSSWPVSMRISDILEAISTHSFFSTQREAGTCTKTAGDRRVHQINPFRQIVGTFLVAPSQAPPYRCATSGPP
jgi:hypothetical protein